MPAPTPLLSFEDACLNYSGAIRKKIRLFTRDTTIEKDLRQEVLLKMWRNWPAYDRNKSSLFTWISLITTTTCIDYVRKLRTHCSLDEKDRDWSEPASVPAAPDNTVLRCDLFQMAGSLPAAQRMVVVMIYFHGHTQETAARLLKVPLGTVKSRQRSAILSLRKMYGDLF